MKREYPVKQEESRVVFPCRVSFVHLTEPYSSSTEDEGKYSVCCIVPEEGKEIAALRKAEEKAIAKGVSSKWGGKRPKVLKSVLRNGSEEREGEEFQEMIFFNASSKRQVPTLNKLKEDINPDKIYSGCYCLVSANFYPYDSNGSRGVAAGLNAVMFLEDGEMLGGADARKDFDGMELGADDDLEDM